MSKEFKVFKGIKKNEEKGVKFIINNKDFIEIFLLEDQSIKDLRNLILNKFEMKDKECKITVLLERPIRKLGILTLNPGELGEIYDNEKMNRFDIINKNININVEFIKKKIEISKKEYKKRFGCLGYLDKYNKSLLAEKKKKEFVYNEDDFPPL